MASSVKKTRIGTIKSCTNCNKKIRLKRWDSWNNFLVRCPFCERLHGHRWDAGKVLMASFILQPLTFFFTFRPIKALFVFILYICIILLGLWLLNSKIFPMLLEVFGAFVLIFIPMFVNGIALLVSRFVSSATTVFLYKMRDS